MLSARDKEIIFELAEKLTGTCQKGKFRKDSLLTNVQRRITKINCSSLNQYLQYAAEERSEFAHLISALTIHTTSWFREDTHYIKLGSYIKENIEQFTQHPLRILCLACSSGEEVYSLALTLEEIRVQNPGFEYQIEGADVDPVSIALAKKAIYSETELNHIPDRFHPHLLRGSNKAKGKFTLSREIRSRCKFSIVDISKDLGRIEGRRDLIFCRNVLIYFSNIEVTRIVNALRKLLVETGVMTLGHSEALIDAREYQLRSLWGSTYIKSDIPVTDSGESPTQILVVDDSRSVLRTLEKLFSGEGFEVTPVQSTAEATKLLAQRSFDLITLDLQLPRESGAEWLERQRQSGLLTPVVILSDVDEEMGHEVLKVLDGGAQDFASKQLIANDPDQLIEKMKSMIQTSRASRRPKSNVVKLREQKITAPEVILIGASTGGTQALCELLKHVSPDSPPILVVQHIFANFAKPFAARLSKESGLTLGSSRDGTELESGKLYMADGDFHISVSRSSTCYRLHKISKPPVNRCRPSVDVLFDGAIGFADKVAAFLLTGMGRDGANGMLQLKKHGAMTFAQDENSSVVFGMPREAIRLGAVGFIGNLNQLREQLDRLLKVHTARSTKHLERA